MFYLPDFAFDGDGTGGVGGDDGFSRTGAVEEPPPSR